MMLRLISNRIVNTNRNNLITSSKFLYHQPPHHQQQHQFLRLPTITTSIRDYSGIQSTITNFDKLDLTTKLQYEKLINDHHNELSTTTTTQNPNPDIENIYELTTKLIPKIQTHPSFTNDTKTELLNLLIVKYTKFDYVIPTIVLKELTSGDDSALSWDSVVEIIKYNPGRVSSSWELFQKYLPVLGGEVRKKSTAKSRKKAMLDEIYGKGVSGSGSGVKITDTDGKGVKDELVIEVLKKLVYGDLVDVKDGNGKIDLDRASKILEIYPELSNKKLIDFEMLKKLVLEFIELDISKALVGIEINEAILKSVIDEKADDGLKNSDYLYLFNALGEELKDKESLGKLLEPISKLLLLDELKNSENFDKLEFDEFFIISPKESINLITHKIQELQLANDSQSIRLAMLRTVGFYKEDLDSTLKLFSKYQLQVTQESLEFAQIQTTMSLILIHESIQKNITAGLIDIAEALIPQVPSPSANNLASLVLYHSWFGNSDKALDIYNKSLDLYMEPEQTKERLMLIESLILTSLLGNDLELGQFIKLKVREAKLVDEVGEIKITELFKEYGELVEMSGKDEVKLRALMKGVVLRSIRGFAPLSV